MTASSYLLSNSSDKTRKFDCDVQEKEGENADLIGVAAKRELAETYMIMAISK